MTAGGPGTPFADRWERAYGCPWPMYSGLLRVGPRDRWQEARAASSAYRSIAAATGRTWWAIADLLAPAPLPAPEGR